VIWFLGSSAFSLVELLAMTDFSQVTQKQSIALLRKPAQRTQKRLLSFMFSLFSLTTQKEKLLYNLLKDQYNAC